MYIPRRQKHFFCIKNVYIWKEICVSKMESPEKGPEKFQEGL